MKSKRQFFALLAFHLRFLPQHLLPLFFIVSVNASIHAILAIVFRANPSVGELSRIFSALNIFPFMFCGIMGLTFLIRDTGWTGTPSAWLMPGGEFLFTRPISRRTAYNSRMLLFFIVLLSPSLLNVGLTMVEPDLRISLYHSKTQRAEDADKLTIYRAEFPNSSLITAFKGGSDTLIIPLGAIIIALWNFWLAILLALILQAVTLLTIPPKLQIASFMAICTAPIFFVGIPTFDNRTTLENALFFFAHHGFLVALLTFVGFVFIQKIAIKRIQEFDLI